MKDMEQNEIAVIGIILRNPDCILHYDIDERWFTKWRRVIVAMKAIASSGNELDIFTIGESIKNNNTQAELMRIQMNEFAALANLPKYLSALSTAFKATQIHNTLTTAIGEINNGAEIDAVLSKLMQDALKVSANDEKSYNVTIKQAMASFIDNLELAYDAKETGGIGLKTGIKDLDKVLGGLHPSDLIVVGARPGVGKTAFSTSVLLNLAKQGKRVGFISSEMSAAQVMLRATALDANIAGNKLRDADLDDSEWTRITASTNKLVNLPFRIFDKPSINLSDVMLQSKAWMIDGGIDFIAIDYLTRIRPVKSSGNQNLDVGEVVTGVKNVARQLNIPVMLLAQLNRDAANRRPLMSDLRDSGIIEQEADQIIMLYRDTDNESSPAETIVEKNRHGQSKLIIPCYFNKQTMEWADLAHEWN